MSMIAVAPVPVRVRPRALERVEAEIASLASQLTAASARLIGLIGEFDAAEGWREWGMRSTAHWLSWQTGIGFGAAREQVRVARAMPGFPLIAAEFAAGRLSYAKVRALTRFATPATEADLVAVAEHATGAQIEKLGAQVRRACRAADVRARRRSAYLRLRQEADGSVVGSFRLAPEQAAVFCHGLDAATHRLPELTGAGEPHADTSAGHALSAADALVGMAEALLRDVSAETSTAGAERYQLVLHTTLDELAKADDADDDGPGSLLAGGHGRQWRVAPSTARRLSCDCPAATMLDGPDGAALHLGRRTRRIHGRLRRAVSARDRGMCRAPGCDAAATQIHHLRHWACGGGTCLPNLISLCDHHHWLVHEGGFTLAPRNANSWVLISADGVRVGPHPEPSETTEPLPTDPTIAADAVTGHWDGSRLHPDDLVAAVTGHTVTRPSPSRRKATDRRAASVPDVSAETSPPAVPDVSAETWQPIDWPIQDDYPDEPRRPGDDPLDNW